MKEKNTFAKLRRTNKALINKFEASNESLRLATEEIDRLNIVVKNQAKRITCLDDSLAVEIKINKTLEIKEKELSDKIYSLYDNIAEINKLNTDNYNAWLEEHETNRKLSIGLTVMTVGWIVSIVLAIGVLLK